VLWPKVGLGGGGTCQAGQQLGWLATQGGGADQPHFGLVGPRLCATSTPRIIFSVTMPYFGHIEDMHGFRSI
jgi:hypothetical protein